MRFFTSIVFGLLTSSFVVGCGGGSSSGEPASADAATGTNDDANMPDESDGNGQDDGTSQPGPEDISDVVAEFLSETDLPALTALTGDEDGVIAMGAAGVRAIDGDVPVTTDDLWHLGSDTKAMTATLVATFVEEGELTWDTTVPELFPELGDAIHPDFDNVTVAMLLAHQSGLTSNISADVPDWWEAAFTDERAVEVQRADLVATLLTRRANGTVGQFDYSNAGYVVAGAALERLSGSSWETLMRERLFDPLGMDSCGFGSPDGAGELQPSGHQAGRRGQLTPIGNGPFSDNPAALGPAGTAHCSIEDWALFLRAHATHDGVVSAQSYEFLQAEYGEGTGYGMGWGLANRPWGGNVIAHAGSNTMWFAIAWVAPETGRYYLAISNAGTDEASEYTDGLIAALITLFPED